MYFRPDKRASIQPSRLHRRLNWKLARNASAVSGAPVMRATGFGTSCRARPIQLFEGSRPWGGNYAN